VALRDKLCSSSSSSSHTHRGTENVTASQISSTTTPVPYSWALCSAQAELAARHFTLRPLQCRVTVLRGYSEPVNLTQEEGSSRVIKHPRYVGDRSASSRARHHVTMLFQACKPPRRGGSPEITRLVSRRRGPTGLE
jgi:hypothetical protein